MKYCIGYISLLLLMEKQLKFTQFFSLKEIALRRVAVLLWNDSDILTSISKFRDDRKKGSKNEWREIIEYVIKEKVLKLELPESLLKQIIDIIGPIGFDIRRWKKKHHKFLRLSSKETILLDSAKLCWTTAGAVDYRKTAEKLVRWEKLTVDQRYGIACLYCLVDYIPLLWDELPARETWIYTGDTSSPCLRFCWPHILKGNLSKLDYLWRESDRNLSSFNQWAFEHSAESSCKTAAEYFFQKLTHEEREASLMRATLDVLTNPIYETESFSDLFCYLLSLMTPEQQMEIVKTQPIKALLCFLDWPWQDLFLENAEFIWTFLPPSEYGHLLRELALRFEDHYVPKLLQNFFIQSPLDLRKKIVDEEQQFDCSPACCFLSTIFESEDSESIEVIFRAMEAADRVKLVFQRPFLKLFFFNCILKDRWSMVEACLREAMLSEEDRERFKETFKGFLETIVGGPCVNRVFKRLFEFLDEIYSSADKVKKVELGSCCSE